MASFEEIVNSSTLNVIVPNVILDFPSKDIEHSAWLSRLQSEGIERERAFFDESLDFFLVLYLEQPGDVPADPARPPLALLSFLTHIQVSYDASYISPVSVSTPSVPRLGTPPRTTSFKSTTGSSGLHVPPSIFPPNTPNPAPVTTEQDRRYVRAEGVTLVSGMWGEELDPAKPGQVKDRDAFALLWDETAGVWVAIYRMCVNVAFLRLPVRDPLLCLTASITVRERPIFMTPHNSVLSILYKEAGGQPELPKSARTETFDDDARDINSAYNGLDEVNLLGGLTSAPTFANIPSPLSLLSTRIGAQIRQRDFTLPSDPLSMVDATVATPSLATRATLRKSFRRTISAVSAFRVRMRTVFVPYILLHLTEPDAEVDHALAAGHTEHTVMLCVELEHPGEAPEAFLIDAVDVTVGGGGDARAHLLPWCDNSPKQIFPLHLGMHEQCNLLFAVELLNAPIPDKEALLLNESIATTTGELQRSVTITVWGRPFSYVLSTGGQSSSKVEETNEPLFPTRPFPSRWNCVLDLAPQRLSAAGQRESDVLPEPPTPFPVITPRLPVPTADQQSQQNPVAGLKRFTLSSSHVPSSPRISLPSRVFPSPIAAVGNVASSVNPLSKLAYTPPSVVAAMSGASRTTYAPPPSAGIPPPALLSKMLPMGETDEAFLAGGGGAKSPPTTPAYPAYSRNSTIPTTPRTQDPLTTWGAPRVPSTTVELPRSGAPSRSSPMPSPPAWMPSSSIPSQNERIIVSVGLQDDGGITIRRLVPYDEFALEIFVFNQGERTRRFEVTFLERRRRRHGDAAGQWDSATLRKGASRFGIVPLGNRVRVGPLRPATCQSVKMAFLALLPGVHTIEAVTLTDTDTQHALTLRTSLDIVVHETKTQPLDYL